MKKRIVFAVLGGLLLAIVAAAVILSNTEFLQGQVGKKLVFFRAAPSKQDLIEGAFVTSEDAAEQLIGAALKARRVDASKADQLRMKYLGTHRITRAQLMEMAVSIFGVTQIGYGPTFPDMTAQDLYAWPVALCISNGCLDLEVKPGNLASRPLLDKMAKNLTARFR